MQKRQNIFSSPQVRMNRQVELNLVTPQTVPPPEALKEQQSQQQLLSEKSPENKDDKFKDQVRPSSKPNIRYVKSSYSQPRGIQAQSLQPSNLKQYLGNGGQNQIATPISAATITNGSNGTIILSRSSLQSPPRSNPKYSLAQQPILAHKNYQRCCPSHSDECLKRICSIPYCNKDILLCGDCMYEDPDHTKIHQQDIILVNDFLDVVEKEGNKHNWKTLIEKQKEAFSTNTQNLAHFPEKHAKEYGEYIEAQKNKIHYDLEIITQMFTKYIKDIEKELIEALNSQLQYVNIFSNIFIQISQLYSQAFFII